MRAEKKLLVTETVSYLDKSDYLFLADYQRITVAETAELRNSLSQENAEFHVIKNNIFKVASQERNLPAMDNVLQGPTAIIVGGENPSGVAKIITKFHKAKDKVDIKCGVLGDRLLSRDEVIELSRLPGLPELRAKLLCLFNTPAQRVLSIMQGVPKGFLNVLQAKAKKT